MSKIALVLALTLYGILGFAHLSIAGSVELKVGSPASYWCDRLQGTVSGADVCHLAVEPEASACDHLNAAAYANTKYYGEQDQQLYADMSKNFCGRRNTNELLELSQKMRLDAMSYVSLGDDETQCDPARHFTTDRCNQQSYAAYYLYMCAAYKCKFAK